MTEQLDEICTVLVWFCFCSPSTIFSVILGQSHRFLGIYECFGNLKVSCLRTWSWGSNPGPLAQESKAIPLSHPSPKICTETSKNRDVIVLFYIHDSSFLQYSLFEGRPPFIFVYIGFSYDLSYL